MKRPQLGDTVPVTTALGEVDGEVVAVGMNLDGSWGVKVRFPIDEDLPVDYTNSRWCRTNATGQLVPDP